MNDSKLQAARKAAGLTQLQLATKSGVSIRAIQRYEIGERKPSQAYASIIIQIADALNVHPREII